jgi:hypothetical protein
VYPSLKDEIVYVIDIRRKEKCIQIFPLKKPQIKMLYGVLLDVDCTKFLQPFMNTIISIRSEVLAALCCGRSTRSIISEPILNRDRLENLIRQGTRRRK